MMNNPTKQLISKIKVIVEMIASGWPRGNPRKLSSGHNKVFGQHIVTLRQIEEMASATISKMERVEPITH